MQGLKLGFQEFREAILFSDACWSMFLLVILVHYSSKKCYVDQCMIFIKLMPLNFDMGTIVLCSCVNRISPIKPTKV